MLEKSISYDFSVTENGHVQVRRITRIREDGKEISRAYYRFNGAIPPGGNVPGELPDNIKGAINQVWTPEIIQAYKEREKDVE
ncbi:MAG: hypothetical protein JW882_09790 [Deltaproteobacteria bacterium]|nr:hypothetical protein [Deltaproteobacteria bacterium]